MIRYKAGHVMVSFSLVKGVKHMKKIISCITALCITVSNAGVLVTKAESDTIIYEGLEYNIIDDTQIELTGVADKTTSKIHIPTEIDGRTVNIESTAFSGSVLQQCRRSPFQ